MTWSLVIHHIGMRGTGDATLIVARNDGVGAGHQVRTRTCLIDGGRFTAAASIHPFLAGLPAAGAPGAPIAGLDVMVLTHYDIDHMGGITALLRRGGANGAANIYDNTLIFDQGEPSQPGANDEDIYLRYLAAIALRGVRTRVTRNVASDRFTVNKVRFGVALPPSAIPNVHTAPAMFPAVVGANPNLVGPPAALVAPVGPIVPALGWWHTHWLVGREILWTDAAGEPISPFPPGAPAAAAAAALAPTITCVAANRYVRNGPGTATYRAAPGLAIGDRIKNEKSLAFVVRFGNFRYYIGGDIETTQETTIHPFLNAADTVAGRVHVIKTSHHGADTATSPAFVARLRPMAAVSSCGTRNTYRHPRPETVWTLDGVAAAPPVTPPITAANRYLPPPAMPGPPRARRFVGHYLTGYQQIPPAGLISMGNGIGCRTAGSPGGAAPIPGHVLVSVTAAQSVSSGSGAWAEALTATLTATAAAVGVAGAAGWLNRATNALDAAGAINAALTMTVTSVLADLQQPAAAAAAGAAAIAAVPAGPPAIVAATYAAATGAGANAPAAAIAAATAGVIGAIYAAALPAAVALGAGQAVQAAAALVGVGVAAAGAQGVVNGAVAATGLFTVTYHSQAAGMVQAIPYA